MLIWYDVPPQCPDDDALVHVPCIHRQWRGPPRQPSRSDGSTRQQRPRDSPREQSRASRDMSTYHFDSAHSLLESARGFVPPILPPGPITPRVVGASPVPPRAVAANMDSRLGVDADKDFELGYFRALVDLRHPTWADFVLDGPALSIMANQLIDVQYDPLSSIGPGSEATPIPSDVLNSPQQSSKN